MKIIFFANTDWYLYNFRLAWANYLRAQGLEVVMVSPPGRYGPMLEAAGFRWIPLEMNRRSLNPGRELALIGRLSAIYGREKPDIVHHFTIKCVVYGSLIARWHGIRSRINAITGMGYVFSDERLGARLLRPIVRSLLKLALGGEGSRLILQNSDDMMAFATARLSAEAQMHLIMGSGVDTARFSPARAPDAAKNMRVLLASRLLWDKGVGEYVEAARELHKEGLNIEFLLAGEPDGGNPASVPAELVAEWHRTGIVTYLGHVDDVAKVFKTVDVAVLPSYYREGVPRSLLEAASSGLPIVTADTPGCREVVEHGVNGMLVPPREAPAIAAALRYLYEHPEERVAMGAAGREKVIRHFDQRVVFDRTFELYRQVAMNTVS